MTLISFSSPNSNVGNHMCTSSILKFLNSAYFSNTDHRIILALVPICFLSKNTETSTLRTKRHTYFIQIYGSFFKLLI